MLHKEVEHVLAALMPQNRLIARVMLHTGLRVGDVVTLKTADLKPHFWLKEQKTGKSKQVGLPADLLDEIRAQAGDEWAFPGRSGTGHKTRQAVWADFKRAEKLFRLSKNIGTHSCRKVYAVELLGKYGDIERVRRALNHADYGTTMIYAAADKMLEARRRRGKGKTKNGRKRI